MNIDPRQVPDAARAGVDLLGRETTLIPGNLKAQVIVLESILMLVSSGGLVVVPNPENAVKSGLDTPPSGDKDQDNGDDSTDAGSGEKA